MFNHKQIELSNMLFRKLKKKFPEIKLVNITESMENPANIWVNTILPDNEDREIEMREMASEISEEYSLLRHNQIVQIALLFRF